MILHVQQELLRTLQRALELDSEIRVGQFIGFMPLLVDSPTRPNLAELEDHELLAALQKHVENLSQRQSILA
jgi:hypothetical protein